MTDRRYRHGQAALLSWVAICVGIIGVAIAWVLRRSPDLTVGLAVITGWSAIMAYMVGYYDSARDDRRSR